MEPILYIETNFAAGIAKGQDPVSAVFLESGDPDIAIVFPGVCFMEAFSTLSHDKRQRKKFYAELKKHAREVKRDVTSPRAASLAANLEQSILDGEKLLPEIEARLYEVLDTISEDAKIIGTEYDILQDCFSHGYLEDPTDNLILCSVLWHARRHPHEPKAFCSGNSRDFGQREVVEILRAAGVNYFKDVGNAIGWLKNQPLSDHHQGPST